MKLSKHYAPNYVCREGRKCCPFFHFLSPLSFICVKIEFWWRHGLILYLLFYDFCWFIIISLRFVCVACISVITPSFIFNYVNPENESEGRSVSQ